MRQSQIESLLFQALIQHTPLVKMLAGYAEKPAIFNGIAPQDLDLNWGSEQFPRIHYGVQLSRNPARGIAGRVTLSLYCKNDGAYELEQVAQAVLDALADLFLTENGETFAVAWDKTKPRNTGDAEILEVLMTFDLLTFPVSNDPAASMSRWLHERIPAARVIGVSTLPAICRPSDAEPILYCRLMGNNSEMKGSFSVEWMTGRVAVHVFGQGASLSGDLANELALEGEISLRDGSPMLLSKILVNHDADPLKNGQITVNGRYGVLRVPKEGEPLRHAHFNRK